MNGSSPMTGLVLLAIIGGLIALAIYMGRRRHAEAEAAVQRMSEPAKPVEPATPAVVELTAAEQGKAKRLAEWRVSERERAAAWRAWAERRDDAIAALKRDLQAGAGGGLFRIERSEDNVYRVQRRQFHVRTLPDDGVDMSNDATECYVFRTRKGHSYAYEAKDYVNLTAKDCERLLWPEERDFYREEWVLMNDLIFGQQREAEQWLDDYLNPQGRRWTYDAFGVKVSEEAEPVPVQPLASHFRQEADPDIYALVKIPQFLALDPEDVKWQGRRWVREQFLRQPLERAPVPLLASGEAETITSRDYVEMKQAILDSQCEVPGPRRGARAVKPK